VKSVEAGRALDYERMVNDLNEYIEKHNLKGSDMDDIDWSSVSFLNGGEIE